MRRCLWGDLLAAADVVAVSDPLQRRQIAQVLLDQADAAHRYAKRFGRAHPLWGNGSLMSRALLVPHVHRPDQAAGDFAAIAVVANLLAQRKTQHGAKSSVN
ncbi:MAG: hypothetical protein ACOH2M_12690 [Cypionkella sp.]